MSAQDPYAQWDAAYVLGALSTPERLDFEEHLAGCDTCRAAVAELAGMPGLLAQVPPGEALAMDHLGVDVEVPPPASLMPDLTGGAGVAPRPVRSRWLAPLAAAAAALLIGGVGGYAASSLGRDGSPSPGATTTVPVVAAPGRLAFTAVEPSLMTAVVDVVPIPSGTELRVECQYARATSGTGKDSGDYRIDYAIWVVDRAGRATELRDWTARPDRIMHPVAVSTLLANQIKSIEIRRVDTGRTVMRASLA